MNEQSPAIAAVGSPSSTDELSLDVLSTASEARLVGSLVEFSLQQEGREVCVTGQVTGLELSNKFHENPVFKNIIKAKGRIPHLSGREDVRTATLSPAATFGFDGDNWGHEVLGTVPPAGTPVRKLKQAKLDLLVSAQKRDLFYIGKAYGDSEVSLPMYVKHFGNPATGGQGEAYHTMTVGKTGSGKSTLAKMLLAGYLRHPEMAVLIIDPKGEFSDEIAGYAVGDSGLPFAGVLKGLNRISERYGITQVRLEGYELFEEVMLSLGIDRDLNIRGADNKIELAQAFTEIIRSSSNELALDDLQSRDTLRQILEFIIDEEDGYVDRIYKSKEPQESLKKIIEKILGNEDHRIWQTWDFLGYLFQSDGRRRTIGEIVRYVMTSEPGERPLVTLDLSVSGNRRDLVDLGEQFAALRAADEERDLFTDSLQKKIIYRIVSDMRRLAESICSERMRAGSKANVNTAVLFEEAHRHVPSRVASDDEDGKKLKSKIVECIRETRKYGLGWQFIDQTISGIEKEIVQQIRCFFVGYGLQMGEELSSVRELIGGDPGDISLYRSFKDPASYGKPSDKKFPWMAFGPVSPLVANHPLFFHAYGGAEFIDTNKLPVKLDSAPLRRPRNIAPPKGKNKAAARQGNVEATSMADITPGFLDD